MPSIMDKLKKNSTIALTEVLSDSQFFGNTGQPFDNGYIAQSYLLS